MRVFRRLVLVFMAGLIHVLPAYAQERTQDFFNPSVGGVRLDFCRNWGRACGQPAADLFCREMGLERAAFWQKAPPGIGIIPLANRTLVFGDGRICEGPNCIGFAIIRCAKRLVVPPPPPPQVVIPPPVIVPPQPTGPLPQPARPVAPKPPDKPARAVTPKPAVTALPKLPATTPKPRPQPPPAVATPLPAAPAALVPVAPGRSPVFTIPGFSKELVYVNWMNVLSEVKDYPGGATLYQCGSGDCSVTIDADLEIDPAARDRSETFNFAVANVPYAGGALWQVSYFPFPPFAKGGKEDLDPRGLLAADRITGTGGFFSVDFGEMAGKLPAGAKAAIFHVRILPVAATGLGQVVGRPSNVMRIYYGADPPQPPPFQFYDPEIVEQAPPVRLVSLEFEPYQIIDWPPGCVEWEEYRKQQEKNFFEKVGDAFAGVWNWASEAYQWAKDRVVDLASALTFGAIPDEVLSFALDAAMASAGIPPDIPNLDEMISGGIDGLASEMASVAVSQIPAADLSIAFGDIVTDIAVDVALAQGEAYMRQELERRLEAKSREALLAAADEIRKKNSKKHSDKPCSSKFVPPVYKVTVENTGDQALSDIAVGVGDSEGVYRGAGQIVDFKPHQRLSFVSIPEPNILDVWDNRLDRMEPMATTQNNRHWWNEILLKVETSIGVTLPGHRECLGTCIDTTREVFASPPQRLNQPFAMTQ